MGLPTNSQMLMRANVFSWHGKVRMAAETPLPPRPPAADDESISSFVRCRFGGEAVKYVADPLLAGFIAERGRCRCARCFLWLQTPIAGKG